MQDCVHVFARILRDTYVKFHIYIRTRSSITNIKKVKKNIKALKRCAIHKIARMFLRALYAIHT
jgi:hypothetical protein